MRGAWGFEPNPLGGAQPSRALAISLVACWKLVKVHGGEATDLTLLIVHRAARRWIIVQNASPHGASSLRRRGPAPGIGYHPVRLTRLAGSAGMPTREEAS